MRSWQGSGRHWGKLSKPIGGAQRRVAQMLPDCTFVELPDSKHEPFLETDPVRDRWLAAIDRFLEARLGGRPLTPTLSPRAGRGRDPRSGRVRGPNSAARAC
jgi:hypothetical protein